MDLRSPLLTDSLAMDDSPSTTGARGLPTGVVTFLLSDVEGSTRLWEGDEAAMGAAIARHYELLDAAISRRGGVRPVEQGEGDSVVGAFTSPGDALAAALDVQRAFAAEPWPDGRALRIRVALHTGEAQLRGREYYVGRAVIRCARLRAIAHGGQTVLSAATRDLVGARLPDGVSLRDLGSHRLKDLGEPERVWQLCHPELPAEFGPLSSLDALTNNLPAQLTSFVGRGEELADLREVLTSTRLLVLTGAGGCGKTRLAVHAAAELTDRNPDGVWWVELGPLADPDLVHVTVARSLGIREEETRPILDTLCERAAGLDALIVLDNCEHVIDACGELVERLLAAAPSVRILATSREPLGISGEHTWRVPSLDDDTAARLFVERAAAVRHGFSPDPADLEAIGAICRRLDGIPLAIELAAARIRMMPPPQIAAGLDDRFRMLTGGGRRVLPRQQTLEMSVAWSHDLLVEEERALLRRLTVFVGGFTLDAAEVVCAGDGGEGAQPPRYGGEGAQPPRYSLNAYLVLDLMGRLVDKSLVQADHDDEGRYRLLETIRLYAAQRLISAGETDSTRDRHLGYFLGVAEELEPLIVRADGPAHLGRLEREHDNLRAAMEWAEATGAADEFQRMTTALTIFWEFHGHMQGGGAWAARALALPGEASAVRARALWGAAHLALYRGDAEAMAPHLAAALPMAEQVGDEVALARILNTTGFLQVLSEPDVAIPNATFARSIAIATRLGDDWAIGDGWKMQTCVSLFRDNYDGLDHANAELLAAAQRLGNPFFHGWHQVSVGWAAVRSGDFSTARTALTSALHSDELLGNACTAGCAVGLLAELEAGCGYTEEAEARVREFLSRGPSMGSRTRGLYPDDFGALLAVPTLARIVIGRGEPHEAQDVIRPFAEQLRHLGMPAFFSWAMWVLGAALSAEGAQDEAGSVLTEAREAGASVGGPWLLGHADHQLGVLARRRGDLASAEERHRQALSERARHRLAPGVVESLEGLAAVSADQESFTESARLYSAAGSMRVALGLARWRVESLAHAEALDQLRKTLGDSAFESASAEGAALTPGEAVAYANRARGMRKRPSHGWDSLTPVELDVVRHAATGRTNPEIGERLFIAPGTVKTHLKRIFVKLDVGSRAELAAEATRRGLR